MYSGRLLFFGLLISTTCLAGGHSVPVKPASAPIHPASPVAVTAIEAKQFYDKLDKYFSKEPHTALFSFSSPPGLLPIQDNQFGGFACTDGKKGFTTLALENPKTGLVVIPYYDKPLQFFSDRSAKAGELSSRLKQGQFGGPSLSQAKLEKLQNDMKATDDHLTFGHLLEAKGWLTNPDRTLAMRQNFMLHQWSTIVEQLIQDTEANGLDTAYSRVEIENNLLHMDPYSYFFWKDQKTRLQREIAQVENEIKNNLPPAEIKAKFDAITDIERNAYATYMEASPATKPLPKGVEAMKFVPTRGASTLFEARDKNGKLLEKAEAFQALSGWGLTLTLPEPNAKGGIELHSYRCW